MNKTSEQPVLTSGVEEAIKHLSEVADGYENAAYIEEGVQALLEPDYDQFHAGDLPAIRDAWEIIDAALTHQQDSRS